MKEASPLPVDLHWVLCSASCTSPCWDRGIVQGLPDSVSQSAASKRMDAWLPGCPGSDRKWMSARSTGLPAGGDGRRHNSPPAASAPDP